VTGLRVVPSHPEYAVTETGEVWSFKTSKILRKHVSPTGYYQLNLSEGGVISRVGVHRLVCEAFHGTPPFEGALALHANGDPLDNRPENLRWGSGSDNSKDSIVHGTHSSASKTHCPRGHPYDEDNTYTPPGAPNSRTCRTCHSERVKETARRGLPDGSRHHGTNSGYANYGCRCDGCRSARRKYIDSRKH